MALREASVGALLDREIMLSCLAEVVSEEPVDGLDHALRRSMLEVHIRAARTRRVALEQGVEARSVRAELSVPGGETAQPSRLPELRIRLATARLTLELRRGDLDVCRWDAADLRASARALRAQASQIRRRARLPYG